MDLHLAVGHLRALARRHRRGLHRRHAAAFLGIAGAVALTGALGIACAARAPDVPAPDGPVRLAIVTWNTNAGRGDLCRLLDDLASGRLGPRAVDYVVLLQEAVATRPAEAGHDERQASDGRSGRLQPDLDTLASTRGLHVFHVPVFTADRAPSGTAILSTRPLENTHAIDLPVERHHRVAVAATLSLDGRRLFVVSTHLENRLRLFDGGPFGDRARGRQARALIEALPPDAPGIVGGDMNTMLGPGEPAWRALLERFTDTPRDRPAPTFHERLVLDHLFFDLPNGWRASRRVIQDRYGSDHQPVLGLVVSG